MNRGNELCALDDQMATIIGRGHGQTGKTRDGDRSPAADVESMGSASSSTRLAARGSSESRSPQQQATDGILQKVLQLVDDIAPDVFGGLKTHRRKELGSRLIDKARAWGMTDPHDIAIYCALYGYPGKAFFKRPVWLDAAERVKSGQITWARVFEEPQFWEEQPEQPVSTQRERRPRKRI